MEYMIREGHMTWSELKSLAAVRETILREGIVDGVVIRKDGKRFTIQTTVRLVPVTD